ncbi:MULTISPECIES: efflux RND transporter periplasmic adaptor subunit [unclassified Bacillus (in: firmicutes)]|uniref:efflux RND transporter periplasmic adaptor subunit n=1 Tax=unclassified Bacillus (in: firmicutes) TaxID=185979 RepID=UPI0008E9E637|nr:MULTISPECIES: efflux RND transporter periplasmic adaptor subunit [unclassified Bacillus (in: firmicutes)]SFJ64385.1 HlyD family secretion protein [Bacillus sp. 71mf]SFT13498.1 HlyD family secretion protein [Bacillus sp. 103mf]
MLPNTVRTPNKKKKWIIIGVIALIIIVAAANIFMMQSKKKGSTEDVKFREVTERQLNNTKLVSGQVKPGNIESFYADATKGKVKDIAVKEGQEVNKGDKLFSYDNEEINLQVKQAEIEQKMTSMRYDQGKKKIDSLKQDIKKAKDSGATKEMIDPLESQLNELEMQQKTADLEKEKVNLHIEELKKKQGELTVYSNFSGVVQKFDKDASQGSTPVMGGQGKAFLQIASKDPFQIQGTLTELQKSQIQKDQAITVTAKAAPKKKWTGKVTEVSEYPTSAEANIQAPAGGEAGQNMSYYTYKASLDSQDGLSPGYHVSIQVNLENRKMVAVPHKSIVEEKGESFVYVEDKGKLRKQIVKKGSSDGDWVEVLEGVTVGKKVVENPSDKVFDGMEVKKK